MTNEEKICPHVGEPCIGKRCSEFVPRHTYRGEYGYGIQDLIFDFWCWITKNDYPDRTYIGTIYAHCRINVRSAERWDKDEYKENWAGSK